MNLWTILLILLILGCFGGGYWGGFGYGYGGGGLLLIVLLVLLFAGRL